MGFSLRISLSLMLAASAVAEDTWRSAGAANQPGLALRTAKAIVASNDGPQVINHALVLVKDGKIQSIGAASDLEVPEGYAFHDLGDQWVMPGMVDLHSHVGGSRRDINDMVYQGNPGLRIRSTVVPDNSALQKPVAAGVTTLLYIPGSGTNIGGVGVLMKTGEAHYEDCVLRDPGSLKIAQGDNPTRWGYGMGRVMMNHHLRKTIEKGLAYAQNWENYEAGTGPKPERNLQLDVFRDLKKQEIQVSTHTQYYQLVMMSILMLSRDYGFDTFIDHGSFDSYKTTPLALKHDVAAILGPREILVPRPPRYDTDGQIHGTAWGFQDRGHPEVGFNTDAPVVPQEELAVQAAMGIRYGFDGSEMQGVRGVTIVPAKTMGIDHRVGCLQPGRDADIVVVTGDPIDPRTSTELVWVEGKLVYDASEGRRW